MNITLLLTSIITVVFFIVFSWIAARQKKRDKS